MRYLNSLVLAFALVVSGSATAEDGARAEAERMLDVLDMGNVLDAAIDTALDAQIVANPDLGPYRAVMRGFLTKHMSYPVLKPQLVELYASEFTQAELAETIAFYSTATGQKVLEKLPSLMSKGAQLGQQSIQDHLPELEALILEEAARIQALESAPPAGDTP